MDSVENEYDVVSSTVDGGRVKLRCVATSGHLPDGASPIAEPTLEESYMAYMAARGRSAAALEDNTVDKVSAGEVA
jgi:hypothetical protein